MLQIELHVPKICSGTLLQVSYSISWPSLVGVYCSCSRLNRLLACISDLSVTQSSRTHEKYLQGILRPKLRSTSDVEDSSG